MANNYNDQLPHDDEEMTDDDRMQEQWPQVDQLYYLEPSAHQEMPHQTMSHHSQMPLQAPPPPTMMMQSEHPHNIYGMAPMSTQYLPSNYPHILDTEARGRPLPTTHQFNFLLNEYILSLSPKKRDKALIPQKRYDNILAVLKDRKSTTIESAQFRFWAKRMFKLGNTPDGSEIVLHEGKPVAVREALYEVLVTCHLQAQHGGRDKTSAAVRRLYSWVPKELIARFVKKCPSCMTRRTSPTENRVAATVASSVDSGSPDRHSPTYQQPSPTYLPQNSPTYQHTPNTIMVPSAVQVPDVAYQYNSYPQPPSHLSFSAPNGPPSGNALQHRRTEEDPSYHYRTNHSPSEDPFSTSQHRRAENADPSNGYNRATHSTDEDLRRHR